MQHTTLARQKKHIQLIHIAKNQLGLDDETYREILQQTTGKTSTKTMTLPQLITVLNRLKQNGFHIQNQTHDLANTPQNNLIMHLWKTLHKHNIVHNPSEQALLKFAQRHFKTLNNLEQLTNYQARHIIEHLKKWCERENIEYR